MSELCFWSSVDFTQDVYHVGVGKLA